MNNQEKSELSPCFTLTVAEESTYEVAQPTKKDIEQAIAVVKKVGGNDFNFLILDRKPALNGFTFIQTRPLEQQNSHIFIVEGCIEDRFNPAVRHVYGKLIHENGLEKILSDFINNIEPDINGWTHISAFESV